ncbi:MULTISPECIES: hypothetical protein [Nocardia]|uniref:hypothetical protein n=1 Tax=Nocardia TaxID=1817 RepID=UPI0002D6409C|nr:MULTISPECIES: hypothetical protein [Nocardia]
MQVAVPQTAYLKTLDFQQFRAFGWKREVDTDPAENPKDAERNAIVDPFVILGYINAGLSVLSSGLNVAAQALSLILPFI